MAVKERGKVSAWRDLKLELDRWQLEGRTVEMWWRDDDAEAVTDALDRLLITGERHGIVPSLAVSPGLVGRGVAERVADAPGLYVLTRTPRRCAYARSA